MGDKLVPGGQRLGCLTAAVVLSITAPLRQQQQSRSTRHLATSIIRLAAFGRHFQIDFSS